MERKEGLFMGKEWEKREWGIVRQREEKIPTHSKMWSDQAQFSFSNEKGRNFIQEQEVEEEEEETESEECVCVWGGGGLAATFFKGIINSVSAFVVKYYCMCQHRVSGQYRLSYHIIYKL